VLSATVPAVTFSTEVTNAFYGTPLVPVLTELAETVAYLDGCSRGWNGVLAGRAGRGRHLGRRACVRPLLTGDGGLDLVFAGYRLLSVLPFLAVWTVLYCAFGRRVLPIMVARWGLQRRLGSGALNLVE
jgi:hypothetical protein